MDQKIKLFLNLLFSIAVFAAILYFIGFDRIVSVLAGMDPLLFALAVIAYVLVNIAMSLRIRIVLRKLGEKVGLLQVFPSSLAGMLASDFTPARSGYFFTAFSLSSRFGIKLEKTVLAIFGPQLLDFMIKVVSAALLMMLVMGRLGMDSMLLNLALLLAVLSAIIFAGLVVFYPPLLARLRFLEPLPFASKIFSFISRMHEHSGHLLSIKGRIAAATALSWTLKATEWFLLSLALGISVTGSWTTDFLFMMVFQASITMIQFLPLPTLAGAGASEAGFAAILYLFGVPLDVGVVFGFLTRFVMILVDAFSLPVLYEFVHRYGMDSLLARLSAKE